jgi:hypothetical protein
MSNELITYFVIYHFPEETMIRRFVLYLVCLLPTASAFAQGPVLKVSVVASSDKSKEVAEIIRAKIGSTLRYSLSETGTANFFVNIICVPSGSNVACAAPTTYYSSKAYELARPLQASIAVGDSEWVARSLFDEFVIDTSAEKLDAIDRDMLAVTNNIKSDGFKVGYATADAICKGKPIPTTIPKE